MAELSLRPVEPKEENLKQVVKIKTLSKQNSSSWVILPYYLVITVVAEFQQVWIKNPESAKFETEARTSENASQSETRPRSLRSCQETKTILED